MKNLRNILLLTLLVAVGCDVLDQEPQTAISDETAIRDLKSAEAALNGLYSQLQSTSYYGSNFQIIADVTSDVSQSIGTWDFYREMDTYVTSAGNLENRNLWAQAYVTVNHANNLIADVPTIDEIPQAAKDRILGEAYFIRALAFFDLTRTFGGVDGVYGELGVPLVTTPSREINENSFPSRASIADSYQQVQDDLDMAESLLSGFNTPNRVSEAAVKALQSRLGLYIENFAMAETYATEVIDNYNFELVEEFQSIFRDENTAEAIFELAYNTTDGNDIRFWYFPSSAGGRGEISLHDEMVNLATSRPNDSRGNLIGSYTNNNVVNYYPTKYAKSGGDDNIQVLRLAEMYLNRAEARVRKTPSDIPGALADLNEIRDRAGLADTTGTGVDTEAEVLGAIELERGIEFIMEGHRWFNLTRTGQALNILSGIDRTTGPAVSLTDAGRQVFPIPSRDMDSNENLVQNSAYD